MVGKTSNEQDSPAWLAELIDGVREEWAWITGALLAVGAVLVLLALFGGLRPSGVSAFVGFFLLVYGLLIALQRPQFAMLGGAFQRRLHAAVVSNGVGFYGAMTLARFLQLETIDIVEDLGTFEPSRSQFIGIGMEWLIGFSVQSMMNSIQAFMWPWKLIADYGLTSAAIVAGSAWVLYSLGARVFPELHSQIEKKDEDAAASGAPPRA
jgi:hypothetical protein